MHQQYKLEVDSDINDSVAEVIEKISNKLFVLCDKVTLKSSNKTEKQRIQDLLDNMFEIIDEQTPVKNKMLCIDKVLDILQKCKSGKRDKPGIYARLTEFIAN